MDARPLPRPKLSSFHAVFGDNRPNNGLAPPSRVGAPPLGNPGSATGELVSVQIIEQSKVRSFLAMCHPINFKILNFVS